MAKTMLGAYGEWAASLNEGTLPRLSFRRDEFGELKAWRSEAKACAMGRMAVPEIETPGEVEIVEQLEFDGVAIERIRWRLAYGPPTEAVVLKPAGATGKLPGIVGLHCHGGNKYLGKRKIAQWGPKAEFVAEHHDHYYGGRAWANALAKRGYVVQVHDAYAFASRRVLPEQCSEQIRGDCPQPTDDSLESIEAYNAWARDHEDITAKSLFCAGTTWPGVFFAEDRVALDILARREDVDESRIGCAGLSGGGLRTDFLAGLDDRIRCCVAVGFMSTWRDFLLNKTHTHTWMTYVPLLPNELDFPEILALRVPRPTMVMNTTEDQLYTLDEVKVAEGILREVFEKAGAADRFDFKFYPGPHKFDVEMQTDAFAWLDRWLRA